MSRTRRATWTYATFLLFTAVTLVTGMVATPRIVAWMDRGPGADHFGVFRAASDLGGYITLLELGISGGILAMLAQAQGRGDDRAIRQTMAAGIRAAGFVCGLMLLMGSALVVAIPHLMTVPPLDVRDLRVGFSLYVLTSLSFPLQPFRALAESGQRGYVVNALIIVQCLIITGLSLLFAYGGYGITGQFLAILIGTLAMPLALAWEGSRRYPGLLRQAWSEPIPAELSRPLWSLNRASMILNVCGRLALYTDSLIIIFFFPARAVKLFYLTQRLVAIAQNQLMAVGNSTWAGLVELLLKGEPGLFARRLGEVNKLLAVIGLTTLIPIAAYNREFIGLLFTPANFAGDAVTILAAANAFLLPFASLWGWMFTGMGKTPRLVPAILAGTVLNLAISVGATRALGVPGPLLGTLVVTLGYYTWKLPLMLRREFGVPLRPLFGSIAPAVLLGIPCALGVWWIARLYPPRGWFGLAVAMGATSLIYPPLAWALVLTPAERAVWGGRLRSLAGRFVPVPELPPGGHPETRSDGGLIEVEGPEVPDFGPDEPDPVDGPPIADPAR